MSLLAVMTAIEELERTIALPAAVLTADPWLQHHSKVKRAYLVGTASNHVPNDLPCFMNLKGPGTELRLGNTREDNFTVQVDFFGLASFSEEAQRLAIAYYDATLNAFDAERPYTRRFGGVLSEGYFNIRSEDDMPFNQAPDTKGCAGFRLYLDIQLFTDVTP